MFVNGEALRIFDNTISNFQARVEEELKELEEEKLVTELSLTARSRVKLTLASFEQ